MKHMLLSTAAVCGLLLLGACGGATPETPPEGSVSQVEETVIAEETVSSDCKDEQPPLPGSRRGLASGRNEPVFGLFWPSPRRS